MPSEIFAPACWRATRPVRAPGGRARRRACPCPAKFAPSAARRSGEERLEPGDRDAQLAVQPAVRVDRQPAGADRDGFALLDAACVMSMRPPAAWISRKRAGQGFGRNRSSPQHRSNSASIGRAAAGCKVGAEGLAEPQHNLDHRLVGRRSFDNAAVNFDTLGLQHILPRPPQGDRPSARRTPATPARRRRRTAHARLANVQFATIAGGFPGSATVRGPWNSLISKVG